MKLALAFVVVTLMVAAHVDAATTRFARCPRLVDATRLPFRPGSHTFHGDVDGDGTRDRVSLHYAKWARASCAFLLTVETRRWARAAVVPAADKGIAQSGYYHARQYPEPAVASLVQIPKRGLAVVVALSHGASTVQLRLYWLSRGRLLGPSYDLVAYGSVTHNDQLDCYGGARSGLIVETAEWLANDAGTRWAFRRVVSRLTDDGLRRVKTTSLIVRSKRAHVLERRWALGYQPFRSCTAAGGL